MENTVSKSAPRIFFVQGFKGAVIDNIRLANCTFTGMTASEVILQAGRIELDNVIIQPAQEVVGLNSRSNTLW